MTLGNDNGTNGQTDRQTDGQTDRVRRNMRPPPREKGRITILYCHERGYPAVLKIVENLWEVGDPPRASPGKLTALPQTS